MKLFTHAFETGLGTVRVAATERGMVRVALPGVSARRFEREVRTAYPDHDPVRGAGLIGRRAESQIKAYLGGRLKKFTVPLDISGSQFQRRVLRQVARIPYGKTKTYGEIARSLGRVGAARAVGAANARNPLPLVIPCHRVVAAGGLGGYGGGVAMKRRLLEMESTGRK